jgi:hypothetical protein
MNQVFSPFLVDLCSHCCDCSLIGHLVLVLLYTNQPLNEEASASSVEDKGFSLQETDGVVVEQYRNDMETENHLQRSWQSWATLYSRNSIRDERQSRFQVGPLCNGNKSRKGLDCIR